MESIVRETALYVPTKNRPFFLRRLLHYYKSVRFQSPIYVGDASEEESAAAANQELLGQIRGLDVRYHRLLGRRIHDGLLELLGQGTEEYAVFVEDDNLVVPDGLYASARFLADHPGYRCACGWGVTVFSADPVLMQSVKIARYPMGESEEAQPTERFSHFFTAAGLFLPYLAVHRRTEFIQDLAPVPRCPDINFIEILINGLSVIRGKSKRLNRFYLIRPVPRHGEYGIPPAIDWITATEWRAAQQVFEDGLVAALAERGVNPDQGRSLTREALANYLSVRFRSTAPAPSTPSRAGTGVAQRKFRPPAALQSILTAWRAAGATYSRGC